MSQLVLKKRPKCNGQLYMYVSHEVGITILGEGEKMFSK